MTMFSELASLFAPYESGTKVPVTGLKIGSSDLADLFAPAGMGAATVPDTGILVGTTDIADLFAAAGTTIKLSKDFGGSFVDYDYGRGDRYAFVDLQFNPDGTFTGGNRDGRWLAAGLNASLYEILITLTSGVALATNTAATYQPLSAARGCSQSASSSSGTVSKESNITITIREIATPTNKVDVVAELLVTAESWGSSDFPP